MVIHQDHFYKDDADIPLLNGIANWEDPEALHMDAFYDRIEECRRDFNRVVREECGNEAKVDDCGDLCKGVGIIIVEGFLLYENILRSEELIDLKFMLLIDKDECSKRRNGRVYEGGWSDPPGYFEEFVWPHMVTSLARIREASETGMFRHGVVELRGESAPSLLVDTVKDEIRKKCVERGFAV